MFDWAMRSDDGVQSGAIPTIMARRYRPPRGRVLTAPAGPGAERRRGRVLSVYCSMSQNCG